jgi:hypothetical protein
MAKKNSKLQTGESTFSVVAEKIQSTKRAGAPLKATIDQNKKEIHWPDAGITWLPSVHNNFQTIKDKRGLRSPFDSVEGMYSYIDKQFPPETGAWKRIANIVREAKTDPKISESQRAVSFLAMIEAIADRALGNDSPEQVLSPLADFLKSQHATHIAQLKNETARLWVLQEWENRTDQGQKKAPFARQFAPLVKKKFDLIVTPETIARDWLPSTKK